MSPKQSGPRVQVTTRMLRQGEQTRQRAATPARGESKTRERRDRRGKRRDTAARATSTHRRRPSRRQGSRPPFSSPEASTTASWSEFTPKTAQLSQTTGPQCTCCGRSSPPSPAPSHTIPRLTLRRSAAKSHPETAAALC